MSGAHESNRKRRPPKMFLISTDLKVQDQLDGTIRLQRGFMCQEQDKSKADYLWVKVLTTEIYKYSIISTVDCINIYFAY